MIVEDVRFSRSRFCCWWWWLLWLLALMTMLMVILKLFIRLKHLISEQGGRTWQPFVGGKNGHENFRQAHIYKFRDKCVVFARKRKFAKLTHWNMQYIPCNSALLAQETPKKALFLPKDLQKVRKSRQIIIRDKIVYVRA